MLVFYIHVNLLNDRVKKLWSDRWKPCSENPRWPQAIRVIRVHPWQQTKNPCTCKKQPHPWL